MGIKNYLIKPKNQYYLLGIPYSFIVILGICLFVSLFRNDISWFLKVAKRIFIIIGIVLVISTVLVGFFMGGVKTYLYALTPMGMFPPVIYFLFTPISVYIIRLQKEKE